MSAGETHPPRPVSGHQLEIRRGDALARVGQVAAVLREFSVAGEHFTETWPDDLVAPMGCGMVLAPWPNRTADARWTYRDKIQQLDITEPGKGNASHGLLRNTAYEVLEHTEDAVTLGASVYPQHGYPFTLDLRVSYALTADGLTVTFDLYNAGADAAPFGIGSHPYLRVGNDPAADLTVTVSAKTHAVVNDKAIPTALEPVAGTHLDLSAGVRVGDLKADACLTDVTAVGGTVEHRLTAPDGRSLVLWADEVFSWVQVYSPDNFPGPGQPGQRVAIAVEPMTCAPDALNSGHGLRWLEPGQRWSAAWGLRPERAPSAG